MSKKDYYELLGVTKTTDSKDIKIAYRKMAMKYHPDVNQGADSESRFKEINEAYEVLSDPNKKQIYDTYGHDGLNSSASGGGNPGGGFGGFSFDDLKNFSFGGDAGDAFQDIFSNFGFGGGGRARGSGPQANRRTRGRDLQRRITIDQEDSYTGSKKKIKLERKISCPDCSGKGYHDADAKTCNSCNGAGVEVVRQRTPMGVFQTQRTCRKCSGIGKTISKVCKTCHGKKHQMENKSVEIDIPGGIKSGMNLRLKDKGEGGLNGGHSGDLYIQIIVEEDQNFIRQDDDLVVNIPIPFIKLINGTEINIPIYGKNLKFSVSALTNPSNLIRVKDQGFPILGTRKNGNLYFKIIPTLPKKLSKQAKKVLQSISDELDDKSDQIFISKL